METRLHIYWDGEAPGLTEHRLSLDAFGPALAALLAATRRIASGILGDALDDPHYGRRGGRFARKAQLIDLELDKISPGSLELHTVCRLHVPLGENLPLIEELPRATSLRLLQDIEAESQGRTANAAVRRYLQRLPAGVRVQRYSATEGGRLLKEVRLDQVKLAEVPRPQPSLLQVDAAVVGLGLEPTAPEVRLLAGGRRLSCTATMAQVERAIELRAVPIRAMILADAGLTLLWLRPQGEHLPLADASARAEYLLDRWDELLGKLAQ